MADRQFQQIAYTIEKSPVTLWIPIAFNGTGAPTLLQWNPGTRTYAAAPSIGSRHGAISIARNSAGNFTLILRDTYQRLMEIGWSIISSANPVAITIAARAASNPNATNAATATGLSTTSNSINFVVFSAAGTPADPAATELGEIKLVLQNSAAI